MQTVSLTLQLRAPMHARLAERASERGWKPTDFALQLLEAAYAARCQHDRGEESGDAKLDRAVRDVFLMADCEPEYIAAALDLPQSWVEKILEGWRRFDPLSRSPAAPPKGKRGGGNPSLDGGRTSAGEGHVGRRQAGVRDRRRDRPSRRRRPAVHLQKAQPVSEKEGLRW